MITHLKGKISLIVFVLAVLSAPIVISGSKITNSSYHTYGAIAVLSNSQINQYKDQIASNKLFNSQVQSMASVVDLSVTQEHSK